MGLVFAAFQQVSPGALPPPTTDRFEVFGSYLESLRVQANMPGLAAAIIGTDGIVWERAFGQRDLERSIVTQPDTLFHLDGLTQVFTTSLLLRCVEEGRLSLDSRLSEFDPQSPDGNLTLRQSLTHTSGPANNLVFAYRPAALSPLSVAVARCTGKPFRAAVGDLLDHSAMVDSVPGPDVIQLVPPADFVSAKDIEHYAHVLERLAVPYAIPKGGRPVPSRAAEMLTAAGGLVSTVRDYAQFDVSLRKGFVLRPETLADAWTPADRAGQPLPHGLGWFVQTYAGEKIAWQFGVNDNATSSLVMTVPGRDFSVVLLANSDGLVNPYALAKGDLSASPFGRLLLGTFFR